MIALGAHEVLANPNSIFGPVDPQLGHLIYQFSAKHWKEIRNVKGKDAKDESIGMAAVSEALMKEMRTYLKQLIEGRNVKEEEFFDMVLEGKSSHGNIISPAALNSVGLKVNPINSDLPDRIVESLVRRDGVRHYKYGKTRERTIKKSDKWVS